jgi:hypothetical protein
MTHFAHGVMRPLKRIGESALALAIALCLFAQLHDRSFGESNPEKPAVDDKFFLEEIKPVLVARCLSCHGAESAEGGLRLDSREAVLKGGDTGPALVPGEPKDSLLLLAVNHSHDVLKMPPKQELPTRDIEKLEQWIRGGAPWPTAIELKAPPQGTSGEHIGDVWTDARNPIATLFDKSRLDLWSLKPAQNPSVPQVSDDNWAKSDLDRFVLTRLKSDAIQPAAPADSRTLARRLHFDLTGLPPTPQQISKFEQSVEQLGTHAAVAALVDEMLASPRFGEHFARLWLDVVRYSDSNGFDWDEFRPHAWRFRDYVVRALNADKPFDQFIREQIAGDELCEGPPTSAAQQDCLIATGFLRLGPYDNAAKLFDEQDRSRAELLADVTETTASAFLALTMSCCRCHDHKYDPISQADHYRMRAFFAGMQFDDSRPLDLAPEQAAIKEQNATIEEQVKPLREKLQQLSEAEQEARKQLQQQIDAIEQERRPFTTGMLATENLEAVALTHVLFQGDYKSPRAAVEAGFLSVFNPQPAAIEKPPNSSTAGRRLTLANWIASPSNPLTARVFVNRIWLSLMSRPLVGTPNDFGMAGALPEDQALLDSLATQFVRNGWYVKQLVRVIATSATYRQSASFDTDHFALRVPRRLSAEQLRDSMLFVSGLLSAKSEGPPVWPELPPEILNSNPAFLDDNPEKTKGWYPSPKAEQYCRSLFLVQKRNTRIPLLETFDLPDNSTPCARREVSTVAPQALTLLNGPLTSDAANAFAQRVEREAGREKPRQIAYAFELALQRPPSEHELAVSAKLLDQQSLPELCRALLNLNEFVYID